jgi:replicative DNA helicase
VSIAQQLERVPPQNLEAEQGVLGSMLLDRDAIARAVEGLRADDFYRDSHRVIFQAMVELFERGEPVDLITITNRLAGTGKLDDVGGPTYLASLPNAVPTAANVDFYASIVLEKSMLRALISAGTHIAAMGYDGADDVEAMIDRAEKLVFGIAQRRNVQDFEAIKEILKQSFEKIDRRYQEKGTITGVATGFTDLDMLTSGLQPADMVVVAARPSVGKCVAAETEIVLENGSIATIAEIYRRRHARLLTLGADYRFRFTEPSAFVDDGMKPVFRVTTKLGRRVETTASHPFLTLDGWLPLAALRVGERIAVPRRLDVFGDQSMRECEIKLLAYFIGDGSLTGNKAAFTNADQTLLSDFSAAVDAFGGVRCRQEHDRSGLRTPTLTVTGDPAFIAMYRREFASRLRSLLGTKRGAQRRLARALGVSPATIVYWLDGECVPKSGTFDRLCTALNARNDELAPHGLAAISRSSRNPVVVWLAALGLWNKGARDKTLPAAVFTMPKTQTALFLNRLFATDGWASVDAKSLLAQIGYATTSERLARGVQHLLLRFGIIAGLRKRNVRYQSATRTAWQLEILDPPSIRIFVNEIGIFGKEPATRRVVDVLDRRGRKPNRDTIPAAVWNTVAAARGHEPWQSLARRAGLIGTSNLHVGRRGLSRHRLLALAEALHHDGLKDLAQSDVYWDEIVSIEPLGEKHVYDLTIPGTHNFVANDLVTHNTTLSLNIAQHAALVHKLPVAIFSLETSKEQLVQRILCSEAQVDNSKLRTGFLADEDWRKLARAMGGLSEAPIFIDDSATMSVIEMRAKARKLKAEHGLGLIVVDYIQMIQSYKRSENRTQELSEIARGIKSLAKELDVPIIAISQLSRAVEALGQKRPMLSHLRECVVDETVVRDADTGRQYTVAELAAAPAWPRLLSMDRLGRLTGVQPSAVFAKGENDVFDLVTRTGRSVCATANHPLLTPAGWTRLGDLAPGAPVAASRWPAMLDVAAPAPVAVGPMRVGRMQPRAGAMDHAPAAVALTERLDAAEARLLAANDVVWDEVAEILPRGRASVYDLIMPSTHNFVANGLVVHNSGEIEQVSDLVVFLYREDYYDAEKAQKENKENICELIIAKHRNGPIGSIELYFHKEYSRFANLEKRRQ